MIMGAFYLLWASLVVQAVKVSACNVGDLGLIPGSGRSPGEGNATHSSTLAWKIPWTEELCRLQSVGSQESDTTEQVHFYLLYPDSIGISDLLPLIFPFKVSGKGRRISNIIV